MNQKSLTRYRRRHLGYVFQMLNLIPNLNVKENIEVGAYLSDRALNINELMKTLGLYEHRGKLPNQLSGGSSSGRQSGVRSSKIRISCSVMSRPAHSIIRRRKRFCG